MIKIIPSSEVERILFSNFMGTDKGASTNYYKAYIYASMLLGNQPEKLKEIEKLKDALEEKYDLPLYVVQKVTNLTLDVSSYTYLNKGIYRKKVHVLELIKALDDFHAGLQHIVKDSFQGFTSIGR